MEAGPPFRGISRHDSPSRIPGVTFPLVDKTFTPDAAAGAITDFLSPPGPSGPSTVSSPFLNVFPYLGVPYDGYHNPSV